MLTKEAIIKLLETNDKAIARALVVVNSNQTATEQRSETTINRNGEGFRPCHARMGTSMAEFFQKRGYLTPKQIAYWRVKDKAGNMRIAIYWRQLAEAAEVKKATQPAPAVVAQPVAQIHPDEIAMQQMEAEADRLQSAKESLAKFLAKKQLEKC